jgi:hypothetical protein
VFYLINGITVITSRSGRIKSNGKEIAISHPVSKIIMVRKIDRVQYSKVRSDLRTIQQPQLVPVILLSVSSRTAAKHTTYDDVYNSFVLEFGRNLPSSISRC